MEQLARIMNGLKCSKEEALEIMVYDKKVDKDNTMGLEYDLPPEKANVARKFAHTGTRKPTAYNFPQKERKPNATKREIIAELVQFLQSGGLSIEQLEVVNQERLIHFKSGERFYDLTLIQKNKPRG